MSQLCLKREEKGIVIKMDCLLGIDIGTSSLKSLLINVEGNMLAVAAKEYFFDVPAVGYAEQDPAVWWNALKDTVKEVMNRAGVTGEQIKGIGFSGQMHGLVALDKDLRPVRKAILHCDVRSEKQCKEIEMLFPEKGLSKVVLNPVFPGMQMVSLLWMRENEPKIYEQVRHALCPKDYMRLLLTGELGSERTDASATLAYDNNKQCWALDELKKLEIDVELFAPTNFTPYDKAGEVSGDAAKETGLQAGTPVAYGGGDQAMQSVGNGLYEPGNMTATIGTSGQVMYITQNPIYNESLNTHVFCHVFKDTWFALAAVLNAGITLNWFRKNFTPELTYEKMSQLAQTIAPGSSGLAFFPAMMGERTPYLDANTRGLFLGVSFVHTNAHFIRAIMEGVALEMKSGIDILMEMYSEPEYIYAVGGAAKSSVWLQIQADIYAKTLCVKQTEEQACTGAAIMAGIASGLYADLKEGCTVAVSKEVRFVEPSSENTKVYTEFYNDVFRHLYDNNIELMRRLTKFD